MEKTQKESLDLGYRADWQANYRVKYLELMLHLKMSFFWNKAVTVAATGVSPLSALIENVRVHPALGDGFSPLHCFKIGF